MEDSFAQIGAALKHIRNLHFTLLLLLITFSSLALFKTDDSTQVSNEYKGFVESYRQLRYELAAHNLHSADILSADWWEDYNRQLLSQLEGHFPTSLYYTNDLLGNYFDYNLETIPPLPIFEDSKNFREIDARLKTQNVKVKSIKSIHIKDILALKAWIHEFERDPINTYTLLRVDATNFENGTEGAGQILVLHRSRSGSPKTSQGTFQITWKAGFEDVFPFRKLIYSRSPAFVEWWEGLLDVGTRRATDLIRLQDIDPIKEQQLEIIGIKFHGKWITVLLPLILLVYQFLLLVYLRSLREFINTHHIEAPDLLSPWIGGISGNPALCFTLFTLGLAPALTTLVVTSILASYSMLLSIVATGLVFCLSFLCVIEMLELRALMINDNSSSLLLSRMRFKAHPNPGK